MSVCACVFVGVCVCMYVCVCDGLELSRYYLNSVFGCTLVYNVE